MRRLLTVCAFGLAAVFTLYGAGTTETAAPTDQPVRLVYNMVTDLGGWAPNGACGNNQSEINYAIFEGLIKEASNGAIVPGVAESWEVSEDGRTWTFHLRSNARWSDGQPVTAYDFEFSWRHAITPGLDSCATGNYSTIENAIAYLREEVSFDEVGFKALDERTFQVTTTEQVPYFPQIILHQSFLPVREDLVDGDLTGEWILDPDNWISNGPFIMTDARIQDRFVMQKNPEYWDRDNVMIDELVYRIVASATTSYAAFQTGELDVIWTMPTAVMESLLESGVAVSNPVVRAYWYTVNQFPDKASDNVKEHLWDPRVREAMTLAIDRIALVENVLRNGEIPADGYIPEMIRDWDNETGWVENRDAYFPVEGDVERARELLAEAGYPNGQGLPEFEILTNNVDRDQSIALAVQDMWQQIGISTRLRIMDTPTFAEARGDGRFEITRGGLGGMNDPIGLLGAYTTGNPLHALWGWTSEEYDALYDRAVATVDPQERFAIMRQMEDMLMAEYNMIPLTYMTVVMATQSDVHGVWTTGRGAFRFENAYRD